MEELLVLVKELNSILWNSLLIFLLMGTGIFYTLKFKFVQIRKFKDGAKRIFGNISLKGKAAGSDGMSSFQALATAIAAQVGTGNLAGAATAIISGGPGAIFWMWVSAFFGMATVFGEAVLGQVFKTKVNGEVTGGPAYYISKGFNNSILSKILAAFFAISCILALGFMGNAVQANSISDAFSNALGINPLITGIIIALLAGFVFFGGIKRIASVTEKVVPVMALLYIILSLIIILINYNHIIPAFRDIFVGAFDPQAVLGGALGVTIKQSIRYGVARGLFSNEAGMGSTPHAHAVAKVKQSCEQGCVAIFTVFIDTFIVLNCTALVILTTGANKLNVSGIRVTQKAFELTLGQHGNTLVAICLFFFAFSTIIGWYFFGEANIKYLFNGKGINIYRILVMIIIVVGSTLKVDLVWEMADLFNGLMVIPNLVGLLGLYKIVSRELNEYENFENN
ncbi:alanine or glycine:cation symporter, AGCS family [Cetobacterium ceti]|uniref:Alanine or glycine:cation symporter, AGCS family n=1 Tax=Cetobacterium ceti TaxID=180163 RepID=A0A1T4LJR1_9FUSO|nr:sodium:alanine symporter family protein [Cetobacterium ceti]SJZ54970.1 alanine or glycine:cation symporter, AGCS family [Cetobacterium ceti]